MSGAAQSQSAQSQPIAVEEWWILQSRDPVAMFIYEQRLCRRADHYRLYLDCPRASEHQRGHNSEAMWIVARAAGYPQGNFRCTDAPCSGRDRGQFLEAIGFELYGLDRFVPVDEHGLPQFELAATLFLVDKALRDPSKLGAVIRNVSVSDLGHDLLMISWHGEKPRQLFEEDEVRLRRRLEAGGFGPVRKSIMSDALKLTPHSRQYIAARKLW